MSRQMVETHPLIGVTVDCDVVTAAKVMERKSVGALGIYSHDGHDLLGLMTERDVTRLVASGRDPKTAHVQDVMTVQPVTAQGSITEAEARKLMKVGHVRHLIVKEDGVERILSMRDM